MTDASSHPETRPAGPPLDLADRRSIGSEPAGMWSSGRDKPSADQTRHLWSARDGDGDAGTRLVAGFAVRTCHGKGPLRADPTDALQRYV